MDLAGDEFFHELGLSRDLWNGLEDAAASADTDPEQRFWALDALVFADLKDGLDRPVPERLALMGQLIEGGLGSHERLAYSMKQMLWAANTSDLSGARTAYAEGPGILPEDPTYLRVFRYNSAWAMYRLNVITLSGSARS